MLKVKIVQKRHQNDSLKTQNAVLATMQKKTSPKVPKFSALTPEMIKNYNFYGNLSRCARIICTSRMRFWHTYQKFSGISENLRLQSQKNSKNFCFIREPLITSNLPSAHVEVSSGNGADLFLLPKVRFIMPKVQK